MHQNYIGVDGAREPYLLSVVQEGGAGLLRAILFNKMVSRKNIALSHRAIKQNYARYSAASGNIRRVA